MITQHEYELLKELQEEGYKTIARDANGYVYVYRETPSKDFMMWKYGGTTIRIREKYFTPITWEDEKPTKIDDLIRDYESHQVIVGEKVKVKIPQYVADWIEDRKGYYTLLSLFISQDMPEDVSRWIAHDNENCERMALAWIYGYEIEKEKLYKVRLKNGYHLCKYEGTGVRWLNMTEFNTADCYKLTQSEIESVDPRLMDFAEEVTP